MIREVPRQEASGWGPWLDGVISTFAPGWAARRAVARAQLEELASFRPSRRSRIDRPAGQPGRADWHLDGTYERIQLVEDARDLERTNVLARGLLDRSVDNVVGTGFRLQATTNNPRWNTRAEALWNEWADFEADVRGLSPFNELLALSQRSKLRDGDVGMILLADGKLQAAESDQIVTPGGGRALGKNMVDGVELDRRGRPVAFHVVDDPDPLRASVRHQQTTAIPAEFFLFLAKRQRLGQTRGLSDFSLIEWLLDQIDRNIEAVTVAARMAACMGVIHKTDQHRKRGLPEDADGRRRLELQPGMWHEIGLKDEIVQIAQNQPSTNWPDFLAMLGRLVGLAFGLPLELTFLDFSRTNYSSARAALLQSHAVWLKEQAELKRFCARIYRWKVVRWIEEGKLPERSDALAHGWIAPGWKWIDPEKELKAQLASVDAGLATLSEIAALMGKDFAELLVSRKKEREALRVAGIPEVRSTLTRDPGVAIQSEQPSDEEKDAA